MQKHIRIWTAVVTLGCGVASAPAQCWSQPQTAYYAPAPTTAYYAPVQPAFVQPQTVMYAPQTSYRPTLVNLPLTANQPINNYTGMLAQPAVAYRPVTYYMNQVQWSPYTSYRQVITPMAVQQFAPAAPAYAAPAYAAPATTYAAPSPGTTYAPAPATTYAQPAPTTTYAQPTAPSTTYAQPTAPYAQPAPATSAPSPYPTPSAPCPPGSIPGGSTPSDGSVPPSLLTPPTTAPYTAPGSVVPQSGTSPIPTYQGGTASPTTDTLKPLDTSTPLSSPTPADDTHSAPLGNSASTSSASTNSANSNTLPQRTDWSYGYSRPKPIPSPLLSATVKNEPRSAEAVTPANTGGWQASRR